jgi:glutamate N-acetyltransferase/amino-acid N-acetyltransferase
MKLKSIKGGVTAPRGFVAGGVACGIKKSGQEDLAMILSQAPARAAAVFTKNKFASASVIQGRRQIKQQWHRAIAINSGNANACTGKQGSNNATEFCAGAVERLSVPAGQVLVASTGIIGHQLPMRRLLSGLKSIKLTSGGGLAAARAIMTTDTKPKQESLQVRVDGGIVRLGGICKGAGMIAPDMATMLAALTTDAAISKAKLQLLLSRASDNSFNCLSIDADSSTNDSVFLLANGMSGVSLSSKRDLDKFAEALGELCIRLTRRMAADGEGAGRYIEVAVSGAASELLARQAAKRVVESSLFKCAVAGADPNWGRIAVALGGKGANFNSRDVEIRLAGQLLFSREEPVAFSRARARAALRKKHVEIDITLGRGPGQGRAFGCDLTYEYVRINMEYN